MLTDERKQELVDLAKEVHAGHVFTDRHIQGGDPHILSMVFMPLALMKQEQINELVEKIGDKGLIYENIDKAGPRGINGYPSFFSMQYLDSEEAPYMFDKLEEVQAAHQAVTI